MNKASSETTKHFGLTAFAGGLMLIVFGFRVNFVSVGLLLITIAAAVMSFREHEHKKSHEFAIAGLTLAAVMIFFHYAFRIDGFVGTLLAPYEQF